MVALHQLTLFLTTQVSCPMVVELDSRVRVNFNLPDKPFWKVLFDSLKIGPNDLARAEPGAPRAPGLIEFS